MTGLQLLSLPEQVSKTIALQVSPDGLAKWGDLADVYSLRRNLSDEQRTRILELTDKMEFESITDKEHAELLRLTDKAEQLQAVRLQAAIELAKLRGVSFEEVMKQLGVKPRKYVRQTSF